MFLEARYDGWLSFSYKLILNGQRHGIFKNRRFGASADIQLTDGRCLELAKADWLGWDLVLRNSPDKKQLGRAKLPVIPRLQETPGYGVSILPSDG